MGIFGRFFGGPKKDSNFNPSADLMPEDQFWDLLQTSASEAGGHIDHQEEELTLLLRRLPIQELITFDNRYRQLRGLAYTWPLWGAAYIINGGCSDDGFCYFRDWLIAQGPDVYQQALADPESLADLDLDPDEEELEAEGMAYVAQSVFEERTGQELPAEFAENNEIGGIEWQEEGDDLARMFPRLWKKYGERG